MVHSFRPLVTIVIPVYNGANFLADAIQSALDQTYKPVEIIVVNDGSNDDGATERVAQSFGASIRYYSKENGGVASALNMAVREMSGEYFSWLSHDDLYVKEKIAKQVTCLSTHGTSRTIVYSDYAIFTDNNVTKTTPVVLPGVRPEHFRYWITSESALHGCSLLIPRSAFDAAGLFDEKLRTTQDYELWFRMAADHRFLHIPQILVGARSHASQDTHKISELAFEEAGNLYLGFVKAIRASEVPGNTPSEIGASYLRLASGLWERGFHRAGQHCAGMARQYGASFIRILGAQLMAANARTARRLARRLFSPQSRQALRRFASRLLTLRRGR